LRRLFPDSEYVSLQIQYNKRFFKKKSGESTAKTKTGKKKSKKEKKTSYGRSNREKAVFRSRAINL